MKYERDFEHGITIMPNELFMFILFIVYLYLMLLVFLTK
jgi:hypothetical protein